MFHTAIALLALSAAPSPEEFQAEVADNISTEYIECAAFYALAALAVEKSGVDGTAFQKAFENATEAAMLTATTGRSPDMAKKVVAARFEMFSKGMMREIENNYSNLSILMVKHGDSCKSALEDMDATFKKWTDKTLEKYKDGS